MTAAPVLTAIVVLLACANLGGGVYEVLVLDPVWPQRPAIVQPRLGGVSRRRFWIPAHSVLEVVFVVALIVSWSQPHVRTALLVAIASHLIVRVWSLVDLIPKAVAFEKRDPATIERDVAVRWTRRSMLRLPLDVVTALAALAALVLAS